MPYSVTPLLTGVRSADQGIMTYQSGYGKKIWLPMWSFLVRGEGRNILVDTGLEDFMTPPEFTRETGLTPMGMEEALEREKLDPKDIYLVINTHLHDDHCGNNQLFTKAGHYIQQAEITFARNPHPVDPRYDADLVENLDIVPLHGDLEVLPGLNIIHTPGHTPGGQTVTVETVKGLVVIPGFCCHKENFPESGAAICPGVHGNAYQAYDSAQKVKGLGGIILPLHELDVAGMHF